MCLPQTSLDDSRFDISLPSLVKAVGPEGTLRRRCHAGQPLYRQGQPFHALYVVETGSFKIRDLAEDGREKVSAFKLRGDHLGMESIGLAQYACDAVALEESSCWEVSYELALRAAARAAPLQAELNAVLASEIRSAAGWMLTLSTLAADSRVAAFLVHMSRRYAALGQRSQHIALRMSRLDMASFLGLKHETVSRALGHLADSRYIAVSRREVDVLDPGGLAQCATAAIAA
ncbi:CRP/FNR family transcriptional regulator, anaerobic regulatory protein [Luteibacter sp. UNCMF331Sha3.1]|uniref:Crp/Fnr family transcriptional regulator n=1 Tax=Luteibacter sp. UNCMF331Sha3.1 TaxID=1502760 RepID=UPI0008D5417C|nr:helix-turn-helix domain-containing protein [Luteibacter sp. UNCMF331Sha3.1]SEN19759.1 CRP/FNR family transcriptional regulator, anaerobic regulatory protein [Luteibacter sp. UNCMF331Sha3.1]